MRLRRSVLLALLAVLAAAAPRTSWDDMRKQIESTLHVDPSLPKLEDKMYGAVAITPDVSADRISYTTAYSLRVPAMVYHEAGPTITKHPGIVIVNGHNGDKSSWYAYWAGILYARAGAIVLTYDPIGEFERNRERLSKTSQHDTVLSPDDMARRLSGLMITDAMQGVSYLSSRRDVDRKRIAVLGYSMGSFVSALTCALDTRIHACVLAGGGDLDDPGGYWDRSDPMCQAIPYKSLQFLGARGPAIYALNAQRGPTLVINGTDDTVVDITHHESAWFEQLRAATIQKLTTFKELARTTDSRSASKSAEVPLRSSGAASRPVIAAKNVFDAEFVAGGGHRPYFLTKNAALWLEDKLHFPNWSKKQIDGMPEIKVTTWAAANHLDGFSSHGALIHEGGTLALDAKVPAVPRDELKTLPEPLWESAFHDYIYESWVDRARTAISSGAP